MRVILSRGLLCAVIAGAFLTLIVSPQPASAQKKGKKAAKWPELKSLEDKLRVMAMIRNTMPAKRASRSVRYTSEDLDKELRRYMGRRTRTPFTDIINDETFLRRATLDLTGQLPSPEDIKPFVADSRPHKRAEKIDELLESDAYARKWARYWRSVIFQDSPANKNSVNPQALEDWLFEGFMKGAPWDRLVAEMVFAAPKRQKGKKAQDNGWEQDDGPNNFVLACNRQPELIASQTARIFMGISIQCAECHDHPFDDWKREQFHEMAAFFAPGKYYMTDQYDPTEKTRMQARFLLGEKPPEDLKADQRRVAVAAYLIYNPDNYWFARAFVNRIWSELIGDGFYPVDSLGPDKDAVYQLTANRIAANFRNKGFDPKWVFRLLMNSELYQRDIRTIDEDRDLFTGVRPTRLRPYEVRDGVTRLAGDNRSLKRQITSTFEQNMSIPQRDLEGSIQQALLLMNNGTLHGRLAGSQLKKDLVKTDGDEEMITECFLGILARTPTDGEIDRYRDYLKQVKDRNQAIDDIMWVLVNSTEFLTKR